MYFTPISPTSVCYTSFVSLPSLLVSTDTLKIPTDVHSTIGVDGREKFSKWQHIYVKISNADLLSLLMHIFLQLKLEEIQRGNMCHSLSFVSSVKSPTSCYQDQQSCVISKILLVFLFSYSEDTILYILQDGISPAAVTQNHSQEGKMHCYMQIISV